MATTNSLWFLVSLIFLILPNVLLTYAQHTETKSCAKGVHVIVAAGYGSTGSGLGDLTNLNNYILGNISHSTYASVPYDKGDTAHYRTALAGATGNVTDYVTQYIDSCPDTKVVMIGYSAVSFTLSHGISEEGPSIESDR